MAEKQPTTNRGTRKPSTNRARLTVEAILDAFRDLYARYAYDDITTSLVAARAGISVGALYQYFANKEAIAAALIEETTSQAANAVREAILQKMGESIGETLPRALSILLQAYRDNWSVLVELPDSSPQLRNAIQYLSVEDLINRSSRIYIEEHADEIRVSDLDAFRYMLYVVVKGAVREHINHPSPELSDEEFIDQLTRVTAAYAIGR